MAARKLTPDSKRANVGGIELHALLQVFDSFTLCSIPTALSA